MTPNVCASLYGRKQNRIWLAELVIIKIIRLWQYLVIARFNCHTLTLSKCHIPLWRTNFPPLDKAGGKHVAMSEPGSSWETSRTAAPGLEGKEKGQEKPWTVSEQLKRALNKALCFDKNGSVDLTLVWGFFFYWKFKQIFHFEGLQWMEVLGGLGVGFFPQRVFWFTVCVILQSLIRRPCLSELWGCPAVLE